MYISWSGDGVWGVSGLSSAIALWASRMRLRCSAQGCVRFFRVRISSPDHDVTVHCGCGIKIALSALHSIVTVDAIPFGHPAAVAAWPVLDQLQANGLVYHTSTYVQLMLGVQFDKCTVLQQLRSAALQFQQPQQLLSIISHISTDVLL